MGKLVDEDGATFEEEFPAPHIEAQIKENEKAESDLAVFQSKSRAFRSGDTLPKTSEVEFLDPTSTIDRSEIINEDLTHIFTAKINDNSFSVGEKVYFPQLHDSEHGRYIDSVGKISKIDSAWIYVIFPPFNNDVFGDKNTIVFPIQIRFLPDEIRTLEVNFESLVKWEVFVTINVKLRLTAMLPTEQLPGREFRPIPPISTVAASPYNKKHNLHKLKKNIKKMQKQLKRLEKLAESL